MSMKISIDIFPLSVTPIRIWNVFSQTFWVINLQKRKSFYLNALVLFLVFEDFFWQYHVIECQNLN